MNQRLHPQDLRAIVASNLASKMSGISTYQDCIDGAEILLRHLERTAKPEPQATGGHTFVMPGTLTLPIGHLKVESPEEMLERVKAEARAETLRVVMAWAKRHGRLSMGLEVVSLPALSALDPQSIPHLHAALECKP